MPSHSTCQTRASWTFPTTRRLGGASCAVSAFERRRKKGARSPGSAGSKGCATDTANLAASHLSPRQGEGGGRVGVVVTTRGRHPADLASASAKSAAGCAGHALQAWPHLTYQALSTRTNHVSGRGMARSRQFGAGNSLCRAVGRPMARSFHCRQVGPVSMTLSLSCLALPSERLSIWGLFSAVLPGASLRKDRLMSLP